MSDDEILGRILRRFLTDDEEYSSDYTGDLTLDGRIRLDDEERAVVARVMHPEAPQVRQLRVGEKFDLAPHEKAEVVIHDDNLGRNVYWSIDGGENGIKGVRIG